MTYDFEAIWFTVRAQASAEEWDDECLHSSASEATNHAHLQKRPRFDSGIMSVVVFLIRGSLDGTATLKWLVDKLPFLT